MNHQPTQTLIGRDTASCPPALSHRFSRRNFLKTTGGCLLYAGLFGGPLLRNFAVAAANPNAATRQALAGRWVASTCQGCTSWCPVQVRVIGNQVVGVRGNPHSKANHGKICPRPHLAIQQMYDPDRVKVPMKRTNPKKGRGENPGFVPISWDEALGIVADKMMELRATGETHKFLYMRGRYSYLRDILYSAMPKIFGSPNGSATPPSALRVKNLVPISRKDSGTTATTTLSTPVMSCAGEPTRFPPTGRCLTLSISGRKSASRPASRSLTRACPLRRPRPTTGFR